MEILDVLADPILPVFAILALGWVMGRTGRITPDQARGANRVAMTVFLPVLVFGLVAEAPFAQFRWTSLGAYVAAEAAVALAGYGLARALGRPPQESVLLAAGAIFANNAFYVLPISTFLYGADNILPITAIITSDAVAAFLVIMFAFQMMAGGGVRVGGALVSMLRQPLFVSILMGLAANLSGWALPESLRTFIAFNAAAAAPLALFALGGVLSGEALRMDRVIAVFCALKLLVFPAAVWAILRMMPSDPQAPLFVLGAAGPASTAVMGLGVLYGIRLDAIGPILIWTCILSLLSLAMLA